MEIPRKVLLAVVGIVVLVSSGPTEAWYKQAAAPSYYSVGRASGLLSGVRTSPYVRRAEPAPPDSGESAGNSVSSARRTTPVCIQHVAPNLQSCRRLHETKGWFSCKADVLVSLGPSGCETSRATKLGPGLDEEAASWQA